MCDIQVDSSTVSRHHALISYTPDGAILADLRSTNGTFVDGHQVGCHTLVPGETITVGDCKIEYILEDERQAPMSNAMAASLLLPANRTR
jgi:pSer/pThr/pTyr-binding forkhead associated (FHA) protein